MHEPDLSHDRKLLPGAAACMRVVLGPPTSLIWKSIRPDVVLQSLTGALWFADSVGLRRTWASVTETFCGNPLPNVGHGLAQAVIHEKFDEKKVLHKQHLTAGESTAQLTSQLHPPNNAHGKAAALSRADSGWEGKGLCCVDFSIMPLLC
eukprot:365906-Chlamydomonas_euryale.AAC.17